MRTRSCDLEAGISDETPRTNVLRTMAVAVAVRQEDNSLKTVSVVLGGTKLKMGPRR